MKHAHLKCSTKALHMINRILSTVYIRERSRFLKKVQIQTSESHQDDFKVFKSHFSSNFIREPLICPIF
jgi:hypothetical protein